MKTKIAFIAAIVASLSFAQAAEIKAPNKGRIIDSVEPRAEFVITQDKKIEIRFLDDTGKVIAPAAQTASVIMGDRAAPTKISFTKDGDKLVSDKAVPEGEKLPVVLQIKTTVDAKAVTEKFNLDTAHCPPCGLAEYACICDHAKEEKKP
ncbi:MAG: hypothetical protein HC845_11025 [Akkermansiaceae bacterium]|nr:hypothetical protein [Akkermansiaceae bacterium]